MHRIGVHMMAMWMVFISLLSVQKQTSAADMTTPASSSWFDASFDKLDALPAFSLIAPSGFTPTQDYISWGLGGISHVPGTSNNSKAAASLGLGLALPANFGIAFNIDLEGRGLSKRQELSVNMGKYLTSLDMGISFGSRNITLWHDDGTRNTPSVYLAATKVFLLKDNLTIINAGVGNNDFRTIKDTAPSTSRLKVVSPFISLAYYPLPRLSLIADYTSGITSLGIGVVPLASWPFSLSLGVYDLAKAIPNHNKLSFIATLSAAYAF